MNSEAHRRQRNLWSQWRKLCRRQPGQVQGQKPSLGERRAKSNGPGLLFAQMCIVTQRDMSGVLDNLHRWVLQSSKVQLNVQISPLGSRGGFCTTVLASSPQYLRTWFDFPSLTPPPPYSLISLQTRMKFESTFLPHHTAAIPLCLTTW